MLNSRTFKNIAISVVTVSNVLLRCCCCQVESAIMVYDIPVRRHFALCAFFMITATCSPDVTKLTFEMDLPRPGRKLESASSVEFAVQLLQGRISDEVRAHLLQYQLCYAGGARAICTVIGGDANNVSQ